MSLRDEGRIKVIHIRSLNDLVKINVPNIDPYDEFA